MFFINVSWNIILHKFPGLYSPFLVRVKIVSPYNCAEEVILLHDKYSIQVRIDSGACAIYEIQLLLFLTVRGCVWD